MYTPTNEERADGLSSWANDLKSNPNNGHMPRRYLEGIRQRALKEAESIRSQPDVVVEEFDPSSGVVSESFIQMLAQPIEED